VGRAPLRLRSPASRASLGTDFSQAAASSSGRIREFPEFAVSERNVKADSHGRGNCGSLSAYTLPVHRSAVSPRALPSWFEFAIRDVVTSLGRAPFVQAIYEAQPGRRTQFVTHAFSDQMAADPTAFSGLAKSESFGVADTLIYVHKVSNDVKCLHLHAGLTPCGRELPDGGCDKVKEVLLREGLVGECEDEGLQDPPFSGQPSESDFWGLVIQSRDEGPGGCYLLKTTQKVGGECKCTHYSLTRVCEGVPLEQQFIKAWTG